MAITTLMKTPKMLLLTTILIPRMETMMITKTQINIVINIPRTLPILTLTIGIIKNLRTRQAAILKPQMNITPTLPMIATPSQMIASLREMIIMMSKIMTIMMTMMVTATEIFKKISSSSSNKE